MYIVHVCVCRDFKGIYQECANVLYQEIDYINEVWVWVCECVWELVCMWGGGGVLMRGQQPTYARATHTQTHTHTHTHSLSLSCQGRNADRFRRNFRGTPWVKVPVVHWWVHTPRSVAGQPLKLSSASTRAAPPSAPSSGTPLLAACVHSAHASFHNPPPCHIGDLIPPGAVDPPQFTTQLPHYLTT